MSKRPRSRRSAVSRILLELCRLQVILLLPFTFGTSQGAGSADATSRRAHPLHSIAVSTEQIGTSASDPACPPDVDRTDCDAELLAMEISGELRPPLPLYTQLHDDLTIIRESFPDMNAIHHEPRWVPGQLIVGLTDEAWEQFQNGNYHGLDDLNSQYGPVEVSPIFPPLAYLSLQFAERYNPEYLAPLYTAADGVEQAEPNHYCALDGSDVRVSIPEYTFKLGWGDCPAGCMYNHYWVFVVMGSSATLVSEYGDPLPQTRYLGFLPVVFHNP